MPGPGSGIGGFIIGTSAIGTFDSTPSLVQSLNPGNLVDLYTIDLSVIGFAVQLYFTPSAQSGQNLVYGGITYVSANVQMSGFKKNSDATTVQPELVIPNIDKGGTALVLAYNDLIGAQVTRRRTFQGFLDFLSDGVTPNQFADASSQFIPEIWYIEQKTEHTRSSIKFLLASVTDWNGQFLPTRRVWKDLCERTYRFYSGGSFNYTGVTCPYTGSSYFDVNGNATTAAGDYCGKDLKHCTLRYPQPDTLPGYFFPGVERTPPTPGH